MARNRSYFELLEKSELIDEIMKLQKRKKYGIIWEEQSEEVAKRCELELPVLQEVKKHEISMLPDAPVNFMIEGDNYHVLSVLNYTHKGKIDAIYIDPPYNTGNQSWKYNNNYVDKEDSYRHSKWLSFMYKRLKLAKNLLKNDGIIVVTIDDYEIANLTLLMNEIFLESNKLATVTIVHNPAARTQGSHFANTHEYALFYARDKDNCEIDTLPLSKEQKKEYIESDSHSSYKLRPLRRTGEASEAYARPALSYPVFYNKKTNEVSVEKKIGKDWEIIQPIDSKNIKRRWLWSKETLMKRAKKDLIIKKVKGEFQLFSKSRMPEGRKPRTVWNESKYTAATHGTVLLEKMMRGHDLFDYPKSLYAVLDTLQVCVGKKKDAVVLDFFAGSGTTAHAIAMLNKLDGGKRQFIVCTNDESNIASEVCYPRIKTITKENPGLPHTTGIKFNLKYMKTDFVPADSTDSNKYKLTEKATEMLCLRENAFEPIKSGKNYKIFKNESKYVGIIFNQNAIADFVSVAEKMNKQFVVYVFSLTNDDFQEKFDAIKENVKLLPIPEAILQVYRKIFKQGKES